MKRFLFLVIVLIGGFVLLQEPSNYRDWSDEEATLPEISLAGEIVSIKNIRNFRWKSATEKTASYYPKTFNTKDVVSVDYLVEPFVESSAETRTFFSFGFKDQSRLIIAPEIRVERDEKFSLWKSFFNQYELIFLVVDEKDLLDLHARHQKKLVYLYPLNLSLENAQTLFRKMLVRVQKLSDEPEFYNPAWNSLSLNLNQELQKFSPEKKFFDYKRFLPEKADQFIYDLKIIDTTLPLSTLRTKKLINEILAEKIDSPTFSADIRDIK